ncbi:hypothetical protein MNBD_GAMMA09-3124 [hydrothermal vent metagenome]|uniref:Uncharacterized protein n=1 Tax=hydrothermal vent metagenome TaxID=652676 RepID=A0A3B0XYG8_9ZZZZ
MPANSKVILAALPSARLICGLLVCGLIVSLPVLAEEQPSLDFLEYLGSEERKIDDKWSSPVDLDIEQYLTDKKLINNDTSTHKPADNASANSEDKTHE